MSGSDVSIVAFGRPERDDAQSHVLLAAAALGAGDKPSVRSEGSSGREHAGLGVITLWSAEGDDADVAG